MRLLSVLLAAGLFGFELSPLCADSLQVKADRSVITPNGDGVNDLVAVDVQNPTDATPESTVFDVNGRRVGDLQAVSATRLTWDGKDSSHRTVESGIYLIQLTRGAAHWNGIVAVAK